MSLLLCRRLLRLHLLPTTLLRTLAATASNSSPCRQLSSSSFTVDFLTTSCALSPAQAVSAARTLRFDEKSRQQPESVLAVLRSHGFSDAQIAELVARSPRVLLSRAQLKLGPKLQFLTQVGFSSAMIAQHPTILLHSLDRHIRPCFEFLYRFLGSAADVHAMLRHSNWGLNFDMKSTLVPNVGLLLELGMAPLAISRLMVTYPRALARKHEEFAEMVQTVQDWGVKPDKNMFLHAVRAVCGLNKSTRAAKLELFKKLGWSEKEVMSAFQRTPVCILVSDEKIMRINSFVRKLGLGPSDLSRLPKLLTHSFEKRILQRYAVWQLLTSKGLIEQGINKLLPMFDLSENRFLDRCMKKYIDKVPELMDVYRGKIKVEALDLGGKKAGGRSCRENMSDKVRSMVLIRTT